MSLRGDELLQVILNKDSLPSLSALAVRLVSMASDDQAEMGELAAVIEQDPGLTTRLLRLVNSSAYRRSDQEVTSVGRALALLGLRQVRLMALSLSLRDTLPAKSDDFDYSLYWRASLHRAVLARRTALALERPDAEEAFVAGLIQEVGLPLLLAAVERSAAAGFPGLAGSLEEQLAWERSAWDLDHRQVGREVLLRWGLPSLLVDCQEPVSLEYQGPPTLAAVADFARRGAEAFFVPAGDLEAIHRLAQRRLGLGQGAASQLLVESLADAGEAASALEIDLDHQADLLEVMEKANQAIVRLNRSVEPYVQRIMQEDHDDLEAQERTVVNTLEAVVHEIRNPLMSVGGFARRLAQKIAQGGQVDRYAEAIVSEAARLDEVLAEMAKLVTVPEPETKPMDLGLAAQRAAESLAHDPPGHPPLVLPPLQTNIQTGLRVLGDEPMIVGAVRDLMAYAADLWHRAGGQGHLTLGVTTQAGQARLSLAAAAPMPQGRADRLAQRAFGPELNLVRARRVFQAHGARLRQGAGPSGQGWELSVQMPLA